MKRPYTKQLYELIYKHTQIKPDPQVFLGMVARAQTVDTRPLFFCERPGHEAKYSRMISGCSRAECMLFFALHSGGYSQSQPETQSGCPRQCSRQNVCLDDWPGRTPNPAIGAGRGSLSGRQVLPSVVEQSSYGATAAHQYMGTDLQGKSSH